MHQLSKLADSPVSHAEALQGLETLEPLGGLQPKSNGLQPKSGWPSWQLFAWNATFRNWNAVTRPCRPCNAYSPALFINWIENTYVALIQATG